MTKNVKTLAISAGLLSLVAFTSQTQAAGPGVWGMEKGDWEFTLGGGGSSSKDFDANAGSFNASVGYFLSSAFEIGLRQNFSFASGDEGGSAMASTRAALDYHLKLGQKFRPYIGASIGGIYGDDVNESFTGGLEAGVKYYVLPKTFLFGHFEYQWSFDNSNDVNESFDEGSFLYSVGVGFNF